MRKILPILLAITVYLTPLYPIYAQGPTSPIRPFKTASAAAAIKTSVMNKLEDRMMTLKDKMASRAAQLRTKLAKFKDQVKAKRVESINTNLNAINTNRTTQMQLVLKRISEILDKLKSKAAEAGSTGKDVTAINAAISDVEKQWGETDAALKAQTEKDYSIVVNSETTVKDDAGSARDSLRTDLKSVHTQIVGTRKSLAQAISAVLSLLQGGNNGSK